MLSLCWYCLGLYQLFWLLQHTAGSYISGCPPGHLDSSHSWARHNLFYTCAFDFSCLGCRTLLFPYFILLDRAQCSDLSRSLWILCLSSKVLAISSRLMSSANLMSFSSIPSSRKCMKMLKSIGPMSELWGSIEDYRLSAVGQPTANPYGCYLVYPILFYLTKK